LGPCHCAICARWFRERYEQALPTGRDSADPAYRLNRQFRRETLDDLGRRLYRYAKARNPDVALFAGAGHRALVTGQADCTEIELHCGSTSVPTGNRWRHAAGESCKQVATLGPGYASGINAVYCHVGPGRWRLSAAPAGWLGYTLAQTIANAGWPYCMMIGTLDTQPDRSALPVLRDVLTFARDHEDTYRGLESVARIGLLWSQRTASPGPDRRDGRDGRDVTDSYVKHFRGWYDLLTRKHRLFDVVSDTQLEGAGSGFPGQRSAEALLARYGLLIVPNAAGLRPEACATLDAYVALGGRLLATGAPPLSEHGLESLGATAVLATRERISNSYFRVAASDRTDSGEPPGLAFWGGGLEALDFFPIEGRYWYVQPRDGARGQLALIPPEDYGAPEQTYFTVETSHPGVLWQQHGRGATAYLPWEPDRAWFDTGVESLGILLDALVGHLAPPAAVTLDAPETVELTAHRQAGTRLIIHLVNGSGAAPPRWALPADLHDLGILFRWEGAAPRVRALRANRSLPADPVDGGYRIALPPLGLFEALVVEPG
jgi:hypothetical protein